MNLFICYCVLFTLRKDLNKITKSTCLQNKNRLNILLST
nr:MAG TPA: hypothetical protein [Caudoviricetes sp.]